MFINHTNYKTIKIYILIINILLVMNVAYPIDLYAHGPLMGKGYQENKQIGPHEGKVVYFNNKMLEFFVDTDSSEIYIFLLDENMNIVSMSRDYSALTYIKMNLGKGRWLEFDFIQNKSSSYLKANTNIKNLEYFRSLIRLKHKNERKNFQFNWSKEDH